MNTPSPATESRTRSWVKLVLGAAIVFAILVGFLIWSSKPPPGPPIVPTLPTGRLYFLMVDRSSEHTAALRGLYMLAAGETKPKLLLEEKESQTMNDTPREWISFPRISPDGRYLAYIDTTYVITEESQTSSDQLMIASLSPTKSPKLLFNIPLPPGAPVGFTWDTRGDNILFISSTDLYTVGAKTGKLTKSPLGATTGAAYPTQASNGAIYYLQGGSLFRLPPGKESAPVPIAKTSVYALSPSEEPAYISSGQPHQVEIGNRPYTLQWSDSWFYRSHVTSIGFSPDGAYLGYTVTNLIVPEEGFYYLRLSDGKCFRLPYSTSRAGWDWTK